VLSLIREVELPFIGDELTAAGVVILLSGKEAFRGWASGASVAFDNELVRTACEQNEAHKSGG